jgi:hypothetical protein
MEYVLVRQNNSVPPPVPKYNTALIIGYLRRQAGKQGLFRYMLVFFFGSAGYGCGMQQCCLCKAKHFRFIPASIP